jgi:3-oxoacyl-[acyl-carrier protein] reductase
VIKQGRMNAETMKAFLVTGPSGGIGTAIAERLARDGFAVAVNYIGDAAGQWVVSQIEAAGGRAGALQTD